MWPTFSKSLTVNLRLFTPESYRLSRKIVNQALTALIKTQKFKNCDLSFISIVVFAYIPLYRLLNRIGIVGKQLFPIVSAFLLTPI